MPTSHLSITAFSAAGPEDPSVRTRVTTWAERTGTSLDLQIGGTYRRFAQTPERNRSSTTLVFRNATKLSRGTAEQALLTRSALGVYELDDGLPWDNGRLPGLGAWWKVPFRRDRIAKRAAAAADRVVVGNDTLADWATDHCADVRVIPTCVEPNDYVRKSSYEVGVVPKLVWIGSAATEFELAALAPALLELNRRTGARVQVIGSPTSVLPPELERVTDRTAWSASAQRSGLAHADVGLMPLTNGVYQRAKCGYKLLQYAAAGLPAVASPVGVNDALLRLGLGVAAGDLDDWIEQITALLDASANDREISGRRAYDQCVQRYSYVAWEAAWCSALSDRAPLSTPSAIEGSS